MWFADVVLLGQIYLLSWIWQIIALPFLGLIFEKLVDKGWATGRGLTTLVISVIIFGTANLKIAVNTSLCLWLMTGVFLLISLGNIYKNKSEWRIILKKIWFWIVIEEIVFLSGLIFMGTMRGFWPNLDNSEKFMDFGFINQYLLNSKLPATDMWLAGQIINYYSFGHFWMSELIRWLTIKPTTGFNVALAISFGWDLMISFSIVVNLLSKMKKWKMAVAGITGAALVMIGGNSHILWFLVKNCGLWEGDTPYWYALATRFIENTIHEFPSYTFTVGDLHAHLIDLPVVLSFVLVAIVWMKETRSGWIKIRIEVLMGLLLGIMVMTNTWDGLIYSLLFGILVIVKKKVKRALIVWGLAIIVSAPWWWSFKSITQGIKWAPEHSPVWQLIVIWSGQILFGLIAFWLSREKTIVGSLAVTALFLIILPEVIYFVDVYHNLPRANTMFKFTYQAFVLLSLLGGVAVGESLRKKSWLIWGLLGLVITGLMIYPWTSYPNFYSNFKNYHGLESNNELTEEILDKYGAIVYLETHRDGKNLLESVGDSFTLDNAISVFAGVPTVLGWRNHERLWRNDESLIESRIMEIRTVYTNPESLAAKKIIDKYQIGWIIVGQKERDDYLINEASLQKKGEVVWEEGENYLIKVN